MTERPNPDRRAVLAAIAAIAAAPVLPGTAWGSPPVLTPGQAEGPFYPVAPPADHDADLVRVRGEAARAIGTVMHMEGRVLGRTGRPVAGAAVEIWQCDAEGRYRHPRAPGHESFDRGFQGFGRTLVGEDGGYRFRTIRPAPYPGRTPHVHVAVLVPGLGRFVTQAYVDGEPLNERDGLFRSIRGRDARRAVLMRLRPADDVEPGALRAGFDVVLDA